MTRRPYPHLPLALALIAGAGCAAHRGGASLDALNARTPLDFRGHYEIGAGSWFRPCGAAAADSAWWVTVTGAAVAQLDSARTAGQLRVGEASYVEWSAVLTRGGEVGPRGPGAPAQYPPGGCGRLFRLRWRVSCATAKLGASQKNHLCWRTHAIVIKREEAPGDRRAVRPRTKPVAVWEGEEA